MTSSGCAFSVTNIFGGITRSAAAYICAQPLVKEKAIFVTLYAIFVIIKAPFVKEKAIPKKHHGRL